MFTENLICRRLKRNKMVLCVYEHSKSHKVLSATSDLRILEDR